MVQDSAQPAAKKTAGQIEKETSPSASFIGEVQQIKTTLIQS
jgi:hypothetical protein